MPQNTSRTMTEDESIGQCKPKAYEQTDSIAPNAIETSIDDEGESEELKERRVRCKERKKSDALFLWNEMRADTPYRVVRGAE